MLSSLKEKCRPYTSPKEKERPFRTELVVRHLWTGSGMSENPREKRFVQILREGLLEDGARSQTIDTIEVRL